MQYLTVAQARALSGLKLVLTCHVPGPWGESAKKIFDYKGVDYHPVAQLPGQENPELVEWTGIRNAPIALWEDEAPRTSWYDILMLGERLRPERPLLPESSEARALVVGLSAEICSEWGFGWVRRVMMGVPELLEAKAPPPKGIIAPQDIARMRKSYGSSIGEARDAHRRAADIMRHFAARLHRQKADGSPYIVGHQITAVDVYWMVFSMAVEPLPHDVNPMPDWMRWGYEHIGPVLEAVKDPILLEHRDFMYARHFTLPLTF